MIITLPFYLKDLFEFIKNSLPAKIGLIWVIFCLSYGLIEYDSYEEQIKTAIRLSYLGGFFVTGFYFGFLHKKIHSIPLLLLFGFIIGRLFHMDEVFNSDSLWHLSNLSLGFHSHGGLGLFSAAALWATLCYFPRIKSWIGFILIIFFFDLILVSQSRSAWVAIIPLLPFFFIFFGDIRGKKFIAAALICLAVIQGSTIISRLSDESSTFKSLLAKKVPDPLESPGHEKSVAIRIWMYNHGIKLWMKKPFLGWGPDSTPELIRQTFPPDFPTFNDLHSVPIDLLVRFGIVGSFIFWSMFATIIYIGFIGYRRGFIPKEVFYFSLGAMWIFFIFGVFGFRLRNDDWRYYFFVATAFLTYWQHPLIYQPSQSSKTTIDN